MGGMIRQRLALLAVPTAKVAYDYGSGYLIGPDSMLDSPPRCCRMR